MIKTVSGKVLCTAISLFLGSQVFAETEVGLADMTRMAAAEGIVLLKNANQVLPLKAERNVSIFGRIQVDYFACGYGSGGDVKTPYTINILDAMRQHPGISINTSLAAIYEDWSRENPPDNGSWGNWPLNHVEMPLEDQVVKGAAAASDIAFVVIGRAAGEDRETQLEEGSYYLTDDEKRMLGQVNRYFKHIVVLLNSGNIFDMAWLSDYEHIDAVLYVWQGGMQGGKAVADVLSGDVSPSGKMMATIAKRYEDYPTSGESGGEKVFGGWDFSNYVEDIYVGYRYFETFAPDAVLYPFGYGLSYTDFEIQVNDSKVSDGMYTVDVSVKNIGRMYSGKEVVQVYYGAPQGKLGKAVKSLAAYAKTRTLGPGESENIQLSFSVDDMASYDDAGVTGHKSAYVLEAGEYPVYVGNSVRSAVQAGVHVEPALRVTQQLGELAPVERDCKFKRLKASVDPNGNLIPVYEDVPTRTVSLEAAIKNKLPEQFDLTKNSGMNLVDVFNGKTAMKDFAAQLSLEELEALCRGDYVMGSGLGAPGNAAVFGGVSPSLRNKGVVPVTAIDGPSGIRLTASASLLPIGTVLACTWNDRIVEDLYRLVGREMIRNQADVLLAPGMNIQRDPLCGRNFEYFSEDPLLTGQMGANVVRGLQSEGVSATPKHFGLNNQETRRNMHDSRCSERAIREIYAKAFEIVVKTAAPQNIMASYNKINGVYSHYNYDLFTAMLREEWGYEGAVMTDWWMKPGESPDNHNIYDNAYRVQAQVDVLMPGVGPIDGRDDMSLLDSYESGKGITLGEMQRSAVNTLNYVMKSPAFRRANGLDLYDYTAPGNHFLVNQDVIETPRLESLSLDGEPLAVFDSLILDYHVYSPNPEVLPEVTAQAVEDCRVEVGKPTDGSKVITIKVSNAQAQTIYRVYYTNAAGLEPSVKDPVYAKALNIYVNRKEIPAFYPGVYEYQATVPSLRNAAITVDTPEGAKYKVAKDLDTGLAVVRVESPHQAMEYRIFLEQSDRIARSRSKTVKISPSGSTKVQAEDFIYMQSSTIQTQECEDRGRGLNIGWAAPGDYLLYRINVKKSGEYLLNPRIASSVSSLTQISYNIELDGEVVTSYVHGGTGGWQNWESMDARKIYLEAGLHKLRIYFNSADVNVNYLEFTKAD
jgi:beta-glucosidase-like glycosyl hydrolase